ncbi:hypothetical protein Cantr_09466 [Candida viswanathii]|uniref:Uncharacterized protein n=1 Tax=Candida viswanathii TaxID=5486 RepID=A0A367YCV1_9ASCO|nr:hypothetical protein Cantr_09466 [Candida viswanathii]
MAPPPPPLPPSSRSNIRKRKKPYSNEPPFKSLSPQPTPQLQLTNEEPKQPSHQAPQQIEDDKLINYINKLTPRVTLSGAEKSSSYITVLLTLSEPERVLAQKLKLVESFGITDVSASSSVSGSIDQYLTIYGDSLVKIARCLLYVVYFLNVRLYVNYDLFTFKTANYKSTIMLKSGGSVTLSSLKYVDVAHYSGDVYTCFVQGDLTSIFNFVLQIIEDGRNVDNNEVENSPVFGLRIDPALHSSEHSQVVSQANKKLIDYLYSSSGKLQK